MMLDCPPEEEQLELPLEEEYVEQEQVEELLEEEPAAGTSNCGAVVLPETAPETAVATAVLPIQDPQYTTPERRQREEPTAQTPSPMVASLMSRTPKLRRLKEKTTVPEDVCPKAAEPTADWVSEVFKHTEEFPSKHFWRKLDGQQQYNWVYERLRAFYVYKVHARTLTKKGVSEFEELSGAERQTQGRRAFKDVDASRRAQVAVAWLKATAPPNYIGHVLEEQLIDNHTGCAPRTRAKGVLLTWMLPANFGKSSEVVGSGEPTALRDVVRLLRASADLQSSWKDILLHARICLQLAGAADVAVCMEVCPETWEERRELKLHVHAFLKTGGADLKVRHPAPFRSSSVA